MKSVEQLNAELRRVMHAGQVIKHNNQRIAHVRSATHSDFLVLYMADEQGNELYKSDGSAVVNGVWPETDAWYNLEKQLSS